MFGVGCFWLKTTIIIKFESHSFYSIIFAWFWWERIQKYKKGWLKKNWDFQKHRFSIFFTKISRIGHWIYRINRCKRHWYGSTIWLSGFLNIKNWQFWKSQFFESAILIFFRFIPIEIRLKLRDSTDGTQFLWLLWFPTKNNPSQTFLGGVYK